MVSRKQFLQLSTLSFGSLLLPSFFFSNNHNFLTKPLTSDDVNTMLQTARGYCKEKKWQKAKNKYEQIIQSNPQEARAYDGLRKCLFQKPKQESTYLAILEDAANQFPDNKAIQQRLCSQYIKIAGGNKKLSKLKNDNLLGLAQQKLSVLQSQYPNDPCLQKQLQKANSLVSINAGQLHFKSNPDLKQQHKQNQVIFKERFNSFNDDELTSQLSDLKSKVYNKEREKHIRELYLILIDRKVKNKDTDNAINISKEYQSLYPQDKSAIYWLRRLSNLKGDHQLALEAENKNHLIKQSFWSASAYFSVIEKYESSNLTKMQQLLAEMQQKKIDQHEEFIFHCKQIDLLLLQNQNAIAESKINDLLKSKSEIRNTSIIDSINVMLIKYFKKTQQENIISTIPYIIINSKELRDSSDPWEKKIAMLNINRDFSKSVYFNALNAYINKI